MSAKPNINKISGQQLSATELMEIVNILETKTDNSETTALSNAKVDKVAGKQLSDENYTLAEKNKLAGLDSSKFKGQYLSLSALNTANVGGEGSYAFVDGGIGEVVLKYIWDSSDSVWVAQQGESVSETPASVKSKYESNADTNAFTDTEKTGVSANTAARHTHTNKTILDAIQQALTTALKTAYDNAVTWISTNGTNLLAHIGAGGTAHANVVTGGAAGFMTGTDKTKLDGIATGANAYTHPSHSGEVTGSGALTITANAVTNAKLADMATGTFKGRNTAATGDPEDLAISTVRTMLSINNLDNTSDLGKPVSTAQKGVLIGLVKHGAIAGTARLAGYEVIHWFGSVEPTNMIEGDLWTVA